MSDRTREDVRPAKVPESPWRYREIDLALGKLHCASNGHRWWYVIDRHVCASCGATR